MSTWTDYPAVVARLEKWGDMDRVRFACATRLTGASAKVYAKAICSSSTIVRVKRTRGSWAYRHNQSLTLSCDKAGTVALHSILHEAAHVLNYRKGKLGGGPHGEQFCRTLSRLLREVLS